MAAPTPDELQRRYYENTASAYDGRHLADEDGDHERSLEDIAGYVAHCGFQSVLDVGTGTGRGVRFLKTRLPGLKVKGIEPVAALVEQARTHEGIGPDDVTLGSGEALPFSDGSFDAVMSLGVLHHAKDPGAVVREMTRVARRAVFISDANRFGQGRLPVRLAKLALWTAGLWPATDRLLTRGKGFHQSEGDGVFYSYSVYDTLPILDAWADRVLLVPIRREASARGRLGILGPLLTEPILLVAAFRDR